MLREVNEHQFKEIVERSPCVVAFFHTPFCGTCKLAKHMLEAAVKTMPLKADIVSCNLNVMPSMAEPYEITSVPCLLMIEKGKVTERLFAFHSPIFLKKKFVLQNFIKNS